MIVYDQAQKDIPLIPTQVSVGSLLDMKAKHLQSLQSRKRCHDVCVVVALCNEPAQLLQHNAMQLGGRVMTTWTHSSP